MTLPSLPTCDMPPLPQVRNEKARRFLVNMRKKPGVNFATYFPRADPGAVALLRRMLSFDPADRPTSEVQTQQQFETVRALPRTGVDAAECMSCQ